MWCGLIGVFFWCVLDSGCSNCCLCWLVCWNLFDCIFCRVVFCVGFMWCLSCVVLGLLGLFVVYVLGLLCWFWLDVVFRFGCWLVVFCICWCILGSVWRNCWWSWVLNYCVFCLFLWVFFCCEFLMFCIVVLC